MRPRAADVVGTTSREDVHDEGRSDVAEVAVAAAAAAEVAAERVCSGAVPSWADADAGVEADDLHRPEGCCSACSNSKVGG